MVALDQLDRRPEVDVIVDRPRRRLAGGSAAVLRRGPGPGGVRLPDAGGQRDRSRVRQPDPRSGRRLCGPPPRPTPRSGWCRMWPRSWSGSARPASGWRAASSAGAAASRNWLSDLAAGRCSPIPMASFAVRVRPARRAAASGRRAIGSQLDRERHGGRASPGPGPGHVPQGDAGARVRDRGRRRRPRAQLGRRGRSGRRLLAYLPTDSSWSTSVRSAPEEQQHDRADQPVRRPAAELRGRPATNSSRWCSGWSPAGSRWTSRWPCGSAASSWPAICQTWLDGAKAKVEATRGNAPTDQD